MSKKIAVLAIHGIGETLPDFADEVEAKLAKEVGAAWDAVHFGSIYYQSLLQKNQRAAFERARAEYNVDWIDLRKYLLFGFSDAACLAYRAADDGSLYEQAQRIILRTLDEAFDAAGALVDVVILAQSLGCHVLSNYIWDAQAAAPRQGIWKNGGPRDGTPARQKFRRLETLRVLYTTGCNIPIFVAGFPEEKILAVETKSGGYDFQWKNLFDRDDPLGWPLKSLSPSYRTAVHGDYEVRVGGLLTGWNPFNHEEYWGDRDVVRPLAADIKAYAG